MISIGAHALYGAPSGRSPVACYSYNNVNSQYFCKLIFFKYFNCFKFYLRIKSMLFLSSLSLSKLLIIFVSLRELVIYCTAWFSPELADFTLYPPYTLLQLPHFVFNILVIPLHFFKIFILFYVILILLKYGDTFIFRLYPTHVTHIVNAGATTPIVFCLPPFILKLNKNMQQYSDTPTEDQRGPRFPPCLLNSSVSLNQRII